jgi:hypothetical protein
MLHGKTSKTLEMHQILITRDSGLNITVGTRLVYPKQQNGNVGKLNDASPL